MRKVLILAAMASFAVACGTKTNDASGAKAVAYDDEVYSTYVDVSEFDSLEGFKSEADRSKAMAALLNLTVSSNEEAKAAYDHIAKIGIVPGRTLHSELTECRRVMQDEFEEEGMTIYTFNFSIESPMYLDISDLKKSKNFYDYDGKGYSHMSIKVMYDVNPVKNGKVSMEGVKILKVKLIENAITSC